MRTESWHVGRELWQAYTAGRLDPVAEASVDSHLTGCPQCREAAQTLVSPTHSVQVWDMVQATIGAPWIARPLRWMRGFGVPDSELVLLGAADAVMLPWITAVGAALACAITSGFSGLSEEVTFFALAPLVPVLAVVAAFDATDSLREVSVATPYSQLRLALLRTSMALLVALPVTTMVGVAIPGMGDLAFSWVLPGLGLTTTALVLLTWMSPGPVAVIVGLLWIGGVLASDISGRFDLVTGGAAQLVFAAVCVLATFFFVTRTADLRPTGKAS